MTSKEVADLEGKCKKSVEHFRKELSRIRGGRATTSLLDGLTVEYYGSRVPLLQLGMVAAPEPRLLTIQVYDQSACEAIEKAIQTSELGLTPNRDGGLIRLSIPPLNEERRKEFIKKLHKMAEEEKVAIRNMRRDCIDILKKQKDKKLVTEDDLRKAESEIQKVIDHYVKEIDVAMAAKEKDMLEV